MKKTYKMFLALVVCLLSGISVNAETISLQDIPFCSWDGWGADAKSTGSAGCAWVVGEPTGLPYGDSNVINYADLSNFTKLVVVVTDGTPRFLFNRDVDEGKWSTTESESHLIEYPACIGAWAEKYFTSAPGENEGETVYTVDLKALAKDKGYAHLHAIKGANWQNVTVLSMEVTRQAKAPQGWTSIINNGDFESDDISSFVLAKEAKSGDGDATYPIEINDTVGRNGGRGLAVTSMADAYETWSTQLFVKLNEAVTEGLQWRFTMDVKADRAATVTSGSHAAPRAWIGGGIIDQFEVTDEWQTITGEGTISKDLADKAFGSIAFDLNNDKVSANTFYFDNINFEVFKLGTSAEFSSIAVLLDFGFDTNIPQLVKNSGKKRLIYPNDCATVKVNGVPAEIYSVEALEDGRFYIFLTEEPDEDATVVVSLKNQKDAEHQIIYASGAVNGQVVGDVEELVATYNYDIVGDDGIPYDYVIPTLMAADPENGAFNLPNSISEFKLKFDKNVDCEKLTATLNDAALAVEPSTGFAEEVKLVRSGENLADGQYTLKIEKIFAEQFIDDAYCGDTTLVLNIGKTESDPSDVARELIPAEYFANCAANSIPEGFFVKFGSEDRPGGSGAGSGSRMFDFGTGGDFTKGLYFREGYVEYGTTVNKDPETGEIINEYALELGAGKKYDISFNSAMWKDNGSQLCFRVYFKDDFDAAIELAEEPQAVLSQVIANKPNVNGSTAAVNGSAKTVIRFVPATTGKYVLRWVSTGSETGAAEYKEVILANPSVKYIPNKAGIELITKLENALAEAKAALEANSADRYAGIDFDNLSAAIIKVEAEKDGYYNPSSFDKAAEELLALAQAMKDHHALCDDYDASIKKTIDVERQNKATKFNATELYAQVVEMNAKYHGTSEWRNVADTIAEPGATDWQLFYEFDKLTENASLNVAIKELKDLGNLTSLLFTEGVSAPENANNGKATGVAVLTDRIRRAVTAMEKMGIAENDQVMIAAKNALTDDDDLVEAIKNKIKLTMYTDLAKGDSSVMFAEDTVTFAEKVYDLTVFAKNPNIYKLQPNMNVDEDNIPGWTYPEGYNKPGLTVGWGQPKHVVGVAEDCMFQAYMNSYRVEQTITDLPTGVYTIYFGFSERSAQGDELAEKGSYAYVMNSENVSEGTEKTADIEYIGQAFPFAEGSGSAMIEGVEVLDGFLTIGANAGAGSNTFFNDVHIILTAAAAADYEKEREDLEAEGIENVNKTAKVNAIQMFDINGRRISEAPRGVVIVKKYMSDGTVRVQKMVKK